MTRKKLIVATETLRTLSGSELDFTGGKLEQPQPEEPAWKKLLQATSLMPSCGLCFGKSGPCHGAGGEAPPRAKQK